MWIGVLRKNPPKFKLSVALTVMLVCPKVAAVFGTRTPSRWLDVVLSKSVMSVVALPPNSKSV